MGRARKACTAVVTEDAATNCGKVRTAPKPMVLSTTDSKAKIKVDRGASANFFCVMMTDTKRQDANAMPERQYSLGKSHTRHKRTMVPKAAM